MNLFEKKKVLWNNSTSDWIHWCLFVPSCCSLKLYWIRNENGEWKMESECLFKNMSVIQKQEISAQKWQQSIKFCLLLRHWYVTLDWDIRLRLTQKLKYNSKCWLFIFFIDTFRVWNEFVKCDSISPFFCINKWNMPKKTKIKNEDR